MAHLNSIETTVCWELSLIRIEDIGRDEHETWINSTSIVDSKLFSYSYDKKNPITLNLFEIKDLIKGLEEIIHAFSINEDRTFDFYNLEYNFGINLETVILDSVISIDYWIILNNLYKNDLFEYNLAIHFDVTKESLEDFLEELKQELTIIMK